MAAILILLAQVASTDQDVDPMVSLGLTASALVIVTIQVAKMLGLRDSWAPWAAFIASVLWVLASMWVSDLWTKRDIVNGIIEVLLVFLASTGGYHITKNVGTSLGVVVERPEGSAKDNN